MKNLFVLAILALTIAGCHKQVIDEPVPEFFPEEIQFAKVIFHRESAKIQGQGLFEILTNINLLRNNKITKFVIEGHSCDYPDDGDNKKLSKARAEAVKKALWNFGIDTDDASIEKYSGPCGVECGFVTIKQKF